MCKCLGCPVRKMLDTGILVIAVSGLTICDSRDSCTYSQSKAVGVYDQDGTSTLGFKFLTVLYSIRCGATQDIGVGTDFIACNDGSAIRSC